MGVVNLSKKYKLSKAALHVRKAKAIIEDLELDNAKIQGDFAGILDYCDLLLTPKRYRLSDYENGCENNN